MTEKITGRVYLKNVNFDFEAEDVGYHPHVAYTTASVGGAASNLNSPVLLKSVVDDKAKQEALRVINGTVTKADVTMDMSFETMLRMVFNMYYEDAAALTLLLGYESQAFVDAFHDLVKYDDSYAYNAILSRMDGIVINKCHGDKTIMKIVGDAIKGLDKFTVEVSLEDFLAEFGPYLISKPEDNINLHSTNTAIQALRERMASPEYGYAFKAIEKGVKDFDSLSDHEKTIIKSIVVTVHKDLLTGDVFSKQDKPPVGDITENKRGDEMPSQNDDILKKLADQEDVIKSLKAENDKLKAERDAIREKELVAKASEFTFIRDKHAEAAGKLLKALGDLGGNEVDMLLDIFVSAEDAIQAKKAAKDAEVEEMTTTKSTVEETEVMDSIDNIRAKVDAAIKSRFK